MLNKMLATIRMYEETQVYCREHVKELEACRRVLGQCEERVGNYIEYDYEREVVVLNITRVSKGMYIALSRQI